MWRVEQGHGVQIGGSLRRKERPSASTVTGKVPVRKEQAWSSHRLIWIWVLQTILRKYGPQYNFSGSQWQGCPAAGFAAFRCASRFCLPLLSYLCRVCCFLKQSHDHILSAWEHPASSGIRSLSFLDLVIQISALRCTYFYLKRTCVHVFLYLYFPCS